MSNQRSKGRRFGAGKTGRSDKTGKAGTQDPASAAGPAKPSPDLTPTQRAFLAESRRKVTISAGGKTETVTVSDMLARKVEQLAVKGSIHAAGRMIDEIIAAEALERDRIAHSLQLGRNLREQVTKLRAKAVADDEDPERHLPHPDDIVLDSDEGCRIIGPMDQEELDEVMDTVALRDALILQAVLEERLGGIALERSGEGIDLDDAFDEVEDLTGMDLVSGQEARNLYRGRNDPGIRNQDAGARDQAGRYQPNQRRDDRHQADRYGSDIDQRDHAQQDRGQRDRSQLHRGPDLPAPNVHDQHDGAGHEPRRPSAHGRRASNADDWREAGEGDKIPDPWPSDRNAAEVHNQTALSAFSTALVLACLVDNQLPPRFRLSDVALLRRLDQINASTKRELLQQARSSWAALRIPMHRGARLPDLAPFIRTLAVARKVTAHIGTELDQGRRVRQRDIEAMLMVNLP